MSPRGRYRRSASIAVLAASLLAASGASAADAPGRPREWKLSTAVGPAYALGEAGERWSRLIGEKGGTIPIRLFPGATLAARDPTREFAALRDGAADLAVGSSLFWAPQVTELNLIGLPWIAADTRQLDALVTGPVKGELDAAIERAGAVPLAYAALGFRALATTTAMVNSPDDLAGLPVRVTSTTYVTDLFVALRAAPRTLPLAEAQAAMKAGTVAAQEGTPAAFAIARLDALGVRHVALWGAVAEVAIFAANRAAWLALSDAERTIVAEAARDAARELPDIARGVEEAALAELRRRGVTITRPTASGRAAFAFAARGAYAKWAAVAGADLVRAAEVTISAVPP
jgi:TRAP-type C4-dicarboxylate transport system substrate-binding protein